MTPEISSTVLVGIAVAGLAWLAGGLALLAMGAGAAGRRLLEAAAGVAMLAGTVLSADDADAAAWFAVVAAAGLLMPARPDGVPPCSAGGTRSTSSRSSSSPGAGC